MIPSFRSYGVPPYTTVLIHGGPGAPGTMGPLAELLSAAGVSVLEPLQRAGSIAGLQRELQEVLDQEGDPPAVLVGHSWGAMFSVLFAAELPDYVGKLVLVGSSAYEQSAEASIKATRLARLPDGDRARARVLTAQIEEADGNDDALRELGTMYDRADAFDPLTLDTGLLQIDLQQNRSVWSEARALRASGRLLELAGEVRCGVVAIHGDYDPHPAAGVELPLRAAIADFDFVLLENCGHIPWLERQARERLMKVLLQHVA